MVVDAAVVELVREQRTGNGNDKDKDKDRSRSLHCASQKRDAPVEMTNLCWGKQDANSFPFDSLKVAE